MDKNITFFNTFNTSPTFEKLKTNPIAYFCAEFALTSEIPTYAGGLGVLAGDYLREANDRDFPVVAVGLYYNDGYETFHKVDEKGYIEAPHVHKPPESFGMVPVVDKDGNQITVNVPMQDGEITARVWGWQVGKIKVYLLDTDVTSNSPTDRKITDHLYVKDRETRLKQEIILGIGGARLLEKLGITPSIYHMNEGHSSLLALEIIKKIMVDEKLSFEEARKKAQEKIVFSNHTLVAGGQEVFSSELLSLLLSQYASELGIPITELLNLGKVEEANSFSLTMFSLRTAKLTNAVSKLHAEKAKEIWPDFPLIPITNGIHIPSWNAIVDETKFWEAHIENKRILLQKIKPLGATSWNENDLILGWARRLVSYKRPMAILEDIAAIKEILSSTQKPVRIIFSGTLHPSDYEAAEMLGDFHNIIEKELADLALFIPEYSLDTAKSLTSACDVWINTPIVGFEACGTSGMKAALNGGLPLTTRDGWIAEIELLDIGWALDDGQVNKSFIDTLKNKIIPLYFERDETNAPRTWLRNMKYARELIKNDFSATRMLKDYIEKLYIPLLTY